MKNIFVFGKGDAFFSFVSAITDSQQQLSQCDRSQTYMYFLTCRKSAQESDYSIGFVPASFSFLKEQEEFLGTFDRMFIFPDELEERFDVVAFLKQSATGKVFVLTQHNLDAHLYRQSGIPYVITSKEGLSEYGWLVPDAAL